MRKVLSIIAVAAMVASLCCCNCKNSCNDNARWTAEQANEWYGKLPWLSGCNYIPSNAINQIEMWSEDTYSHDLIDTEMGWAEELGFNTMRVFLSSVVYANDPEGMKDRMDDFLTVCASHGVKPFFVFLDDCWAEECEYGKQPEPKPGVHNSGWVRDPSVSLRADTVKLYADLGKYVTDVVSRFADDERILMWDLYNEPGNNNHGVSSLPLLKKVFEWARAGKPSQPLTAGLWRFSADFAPLNAFQLENSDVISYHDYHGVESHAVRMQDFSVYNRPVFCTEYMARTRNSTFQDVMPELKKHNIAAINWGFVAGKTNTIYAWDTPIPSGEEPAVWFHDILRTDHTPYSQEEVDLIKELNKKAE